MSNQNIIADLSMLECLQNRANADMGIPQSQMSVFDVRVENADSSKSEALRAFDNADDKTKKNILKVYGTPDTWHPTDFQKIVNLINRNK